MMRWWRNDARESRRQEKMLQKSLRGITSVNGVKNISLGVNPLLTSHTPVWRSRLMVAGLALGFIGLSVRAAYIQIIGNDFFVRQGEVRFARTLELPANRGRILDRNGLILASSIPAQAIWAFPEEVSQQADHAKLAAMAKLLGMSLKDVQAKLADVASEAVARAILADLNDRIRAHYARPSAGPLIAVRLVDVEAELATWRHPVDSEFDVPEGYQLITGLALGYRSDDAVNQFRADHPPVTRVATAR